MSAVIITPDPCRWKGCEQPHPKGKHPKRRRPGKPVRMDEMPLAEYRAVMTELFSQEGEYAQSGNTANFLCTFCPEVHPHIHMRPECEDCGADMRGAEIPSARPGEPPIYFWKCPACHGN